MRKQEGSRAKIHAQFPGCRGPCQPCKAHDITALHKVAPGSWQPQHRTPFATGTPPSLSSKVAFTHRPCHFASARANTVGKKKGVYGHGSYRKSSLGDCHQLSNLPWLCVQYLLLLPPPATPPLFSSQVKGRRTLSKLASAMPDLKIPTFLFHGTTPLSFECRHDE